MLWKDVENNRETVDWLLEGPPWMRYAAELHLLDSRPELQPVLSDPVITEIVQRLKDNRRGLPAIQDGSMNSDEYENPYWDLYFLSDLGLTAAELGLNREVGDFLNLQHDNGSYSTESGMESTYLCKSAIIISSVAGMGYQDDPHVRKYIEMLLPRQRLDGGWYCNPNHDMGNALQHEPSCPQENLNVLRLLGQYPEYRNEPRFSKAIDLLLRHWEMRHSGAQIVYFGVGRRYQSLGYPATRYGILRVLDALSLFPHATRQGSFRNMLEFVHHKGLAGRYSVETPTPYTDYEEQGKPSRLLAFLISRIEKRVYENS